MARSKTGMIMVESKQSAAYRYTVAFFLYATLIIDLYRKLVGVNVETVRNIVYVICLLLVIGDSIKTKKITHMLLVFGVMSLLYCLSILINPGNERVFLSAWLLFVSRLWPAYYIGRFTKDWAGVSFCVRKFIWIALLYAIVAYTSGLYDISGANSSYATISKNLFYVVWIAFYDSYSKHKVLSFIVCVICFVPVLFLGTRSCMFGALLVILLFFSRSLGRSNAQKKMGYYAFFILFAVLIVVLFNTLSNYLYELLPNSRTLSLLRSGDIFLDSNRSESYYMRLSDSLRKNPLRMYGLLGNQILMAGKDATLDVILSLFAHNVYLELCMNFGLVIGVLLCTYFTIILITAFIKSKRRSRDIEFVFLGILGMTYVNMMTAFSWLFSYEIWLLFGLAYSILRSKNITFSPML